MYVERENKGRKRDRERFVIVEASKSKFHRTGQQAGISSRHRY
jgi:hypothetical protein